VDAPVLIYVSCNPAALARDAAVLQSSGYKMKKLYCADFFPHTTHMESMAVFEKS
jgi:23S rRNA (uracil1939-C5)-methyltransferase